jgi:hypothetical protein
MSVVGWVSGLFGGGSSAAQQQADEAVRAKAEVDAAAFAEAKAKGEIVDYEVDLETGAWSVTVTEGPSGD